MPRRSPGAEGSAKKGGAPVEVFKPGVNKERPVVVVTPTPEEIERILSEMEAGQPPSDKETAILSRAQEIGLLDEVMGKQVEAIKKYIEGSEDPKDAGVEFAPDVREAADFAAKVLAVTGRVAAEQRLLLLTKVSERMRESGWKKKNKKGRERLEEVIKECERITEELIEEGVVLPNGVSQVFAKKGTMETVVNTEYAVSTGFRGVLAGAELGVGATGLILIMQRAGLEVAQWSPAHFVALAGAGAIVAATTGVAGRAIRDLADKKPITLSFVGAAALAAALPTGNAATFALAFDTSGQAADTVRAMTNAVQSIRRELTRAEVREDTNVSAIESAITNAEQRLEAVVAAEAGGDSAPGVGGSGDEGVGPRTAIKAGITGARGVAIPPELRNSPEVVARVRAGRARINALMRPLGEEYQLREGESVASALRRFGQRYSVQAAPLFERLEGARGQEGQYAQLIGLAERIVHDADPLQAKINTITGQPTAGRSDLEREQRELSGTLTELAAIFETEMGTPMERLIQAVSDEMNLLGDPNPIEVTVPEFNPDASVLDSVPLPEGRGLGNPEFWRSVFVEHFRDKGVWVVLFTIAAFLGLGWSYAQARRLAKHQTPQFDSKLEQLAGGSKEEGIELTYAKKQAEMFSLKLAGVNGLLVSEGMQKLLPFDDDLSWFQLSPLELLVAAREANAKGFHPLVTEGKDNPLIATGRVLYDGAKEMTAMTPEQDRITALNRYLEILKNGDRLTLAVESSALPGLNKIMGLAMEVSALSDRDAKEVAESSSASKIREFQVAVIGMATEHIAFRSRIAQTTIDVIRSAFTELHETGEFKDLDVIGLETLPKDISINLDGEAVLPEQLTGELLRGSALRSVAERVLDQYLKKEQEKIEVLEEHLGRVLTLIESIPGQAGATDPSFVEAAAKARAEVEQAKLAFKGHNDKRMNELTSRALVQRILMKEVKNSVRNMMREHPVQTDGPAPVEYDAREQIEAIGNVLRSYNNIPMTPGYRLERRLERKKQGEDSVADYLAVEVSVVREQDGSRLAQQEFPLRQVLGKGMAPEVVVDTFTRWLDRRAPYLSVSQRYDELLRRLETDIASLATVMAPYRRGNIPDIQLGKNAETKLTEFYRNVLPAREQHRQLAALRDDATRSRSDFTKRQEAVLAGRPGEEDRRASGQRALLTASERALTDYAKVVGEIDNYNYNFEPMLGRVRAVNERVQQIRGAKVTFKAFDPMRETRGREGTETFIIENNTLVPFGQKAPIQATLPQLESALRQNPTNYASLARAIRG